jgi:AcrR family transcriptional regulator
VSTFDGRKVGDRYHHGDLRRALIAIGVELLAEEGADALSLRHIAKRAGVSHNAPYQHFADKEALLAAIAEEGFRILGERIEASQPGEGAGDPQAALTAAGQAYVRFALEHRGHFQIMFGALGQSAYPALARDARATFDQLAGIVAAAGSTVQPAEAALAVWTMLHGLSSVLIAQKIPPDIAAGRSPEALAAAQLDILWRGLEGRA